MTNLEGALEYLNDYFTSMYERAMEGQKQLSMYRHESLICEVREDQRYYRIINPKEYGGKPHYCGSFQKNWEVQYVAACQYFHKAADKASQSLCSLDTFRRNISDIDPNFFPEELPQAYQLQPPFVYDQMGVIDINAWQNKPRRFSDKHPEGKKYRSKDGWLVRSKSEVLCADGYSDAGIPYVYEALRKVAGRWIAPDFEALCIRKYIEIIHEHCGRMDDPDYVMGSFVPRLSLYLQAGYTIGVDLIFTFETKQTPLTPQAVTDLLAQYF